MLFSFQFELLEMRDYTDDDLAGGRTDSGLLLPKYGKNLQPAFYSLKFYHVTPIFYCLISYVNHLIALPITHQASFLCHFTSFVYCFMSFILRSRVCCLPSARFCCLSALFWLYQLCSRAHHHHQATATAMTHFYHSLLPLLQSCSWYFETFRIFTNFFFFFTASEMMCDYYLQTRYIRVVSWVA